MKIMHCNSSVQYTFDYSLGEPRIEASPRELNKVIIHFNEKYDAEITSFTNSLFGREEDLSSEKQEKTLELRFQSRAMKDGFLLIIKAFNTKKAMKTSAIVGKL
jgi:hypothetical protein